LEVTLSTRSKQTREERAEASFQKKQEQARDGGQARAEYEAAARAVLKNTARLRALRLAKEATEATAKTTTKPRTAAKKLKPTSVYGTWLTRRPSAVGVRLLGVLRHSRKVE